MKNFTSFFIFCLISSNLAAQSFAGKKILTSTISTIGVGKTSTKDEYSSFTTSNKSSNFNIRPEFIYGKVSSKNVLIGYGLGLSYSHNKSTTSTGYKYSARTYTIQPTMIVQKFLQITEKIYYTPFARLAIGYESGRVSNSPTNIHGYIGSLNFSPLSVTINLKPKTNLILLAGGVGINYNYATSEATDPGNPFTTKTKILSAGAGVNSFAVGVQLVI